MFTTFSVLGPARPGNDQIGTRLNPPPTSTSRPRRRQVSRACSWCRTYRIKCDDGIPCRPCVTKGRECTEKGANEIRTFSLALKEISRLKSRVTELEGQLSRTNCPPQSCTQSPCLPENLDPFKEHGGNRGSWEYIYSKISNSRHSQCYGPASPFLFMANMNSYLEKTLSSGYSHVSLQSDVAPLFSSIESQPSSNKKRLLRRTNSTGQKLLSRWQEESFLELFWSSYNCLFPILEEAEFRAHHNSIWTMPYEPRKPSALVDIILAVTMQYGTALLPPDLTKAAVNAEEKGKDAATAGRSYFRRCQALLTEELETPSITTIQCHIFSVIYLSNAGSHNAAYGTLALACRAAVMLGLHREPLGEEDECRRDFRRRLWWTLYALEIKAAMELGRPLAISFPEVTCRLPSGTPKMGSVSIPGVNISPTTGSCFTSNLQFSKLILAARSVYITFYDRCADLLGPNQHEALSAEPQLLEACAEFLSSKMKYLEAWLLDVPDSLRMRRKGERDPFSTDGSPLDIQLTVPFTQQRQRLFLELHYHTLAMNLYRHFIIFSQPLPAKTEQTEANAISCVDHAMTITNIIHQMLTETDLLGGWLETFHFHASAFLSLVGYILAYPTGKRCAEVRKAVGKATLTFDMLSKSLAIAASAAEMARELVATVELVLNRFRTDLKTSTSQPNTDELLLDYNGLSADSTCLPTLEDCGPQDALSADALRMMDNELWWPELLHTFDMNGGMDWMTADGNHTSEIWTLEQDFNADSFSLWPMEDP